MKRAWMTALCAAGALAACKGGDEGKGATAAATSKPAATSAATTAATAPVSAATTAHPAPAKPPPGRSTAPTLEEWASQRKEVTVKGSSALKCETKIVREYLRISCKGKVDPEGTPTGIKVFRGGREAQVFAAGGVASLILPYVDGTDFEAVFSWTKKSHKLVVKWPKGSNQPVIVGVFEGAASPLDGTAKGDAEKLCECHKKVTHQADCENLYGAPDADCDRTYANDCQKLLACARGEPSAMPHCLPGFVNIAGIGRCHKECGAGKPACPAGFVCRPDWGVDVCWED